MGKWIKAHAIAQALGILLVGRKQMTDKMEFPETWEEFEKQYGFTDTEEVYTNGSRLIQSFRVEQWLEHLDSACKKKSDFYPCADEDGMVDVSDYPYTK